MARPTVSVEIALTANPGEVEAGSTPSYLQLSGAGHVSTPDHASLDVVDPDMRIVLAMNDYTPAGQQALVSKYDTASNGRSFVSQVLTTGVLSSAWSDDGSANAGHQAQADSTVANGVTDGAAIAFRAKIIGATRLTRYYKKTSTIATALADAGDDDGWTQIGADVTGTTSITSIFASTTPLRIGAFFSSGSPTAQLVAQVYAMVLKDGATTVANPDFTDLEDGTTSFVDGVGRTWTLNGDATIVGTTTPWEPMTASPDRFISADISGGRESDLDRFGAGTARVLLDNYDRYLDPTNTAAPAPYNGNVLPTREVRVRATYDAITYDLFRGFIEDYAFTFNGQGRTVELSCADGFKVLGALSLPRSEFFIDVQDLAPVTWWSFGETEGEHVSDVVGTMHGFREGVLTSGDSLILNDDDPSLGIDDAGRVSVPNGQLPAPPFTICGWFRYDGTDQEAADYIGTRVILDAYGEGVMVMAQTRADGDKLLHFSASDAGDSNSAESTVTVMDQGDTHSFACVLRTSGVMKVYVDGIDVTSQTFGPNPVTPTGTGLVIGAWSHSITYDITAFEPSPWIGAIDELMVFDRELSAGEVAALHNSSVAGWSGDRSGERVERILDVIGWPADLRDVDTGNSIVQSEPFDETALGYLLKVSEAEDGELYMTGAGAVRFGERHDRLRPPRSDVAAVLENDTTADAFVDLNVSFSENDVYNVASLSRRGGLVFTYSDPSSVAKHYQRTYEVGDLMLESDAEVADRAIWIVLNRKDARMRVTGLVMRPELNDGLWPLVLGLKFGDRVQVVGNIVGGGDAIEAECFIERIDHAIRDGGWVTTYALSEAPPLSFLVLDNATLGNLDEEALAH